MSEAWSWASVLNADAQSQNTKADFNLSTCPKIPSAGQVDRSDSPLKRKHQHDLCGQNFQGIDDTLRYFLMRLMVEWNERASLMTCGSISPEQAEELAWRDLNMGEVFSSLRRGH